MKEVDGIFLIADDEGQEEEEATEVEEEEMKVVVVRQIKINGRQYFCIQDRITVPILILAPS
jgi:hypothetical protein